VEPLKMMLASEFCEEVGCCTGIDQALEKCGIGYRALQVFGAWNWQTRLGGERGIVVQHFSPDSRPGIALGLSQQGGQIEFGWTEGGLFEVEAKQARWGDEEVMRREFEVDESFSAFGEEINEGTSLLIDLLPLIP